MGPRELIASRIAQELCDGEYVNLGYGIPTLVAEFLPPERQIFFHSENGVLGYRGLAPGERGSPDLVSAGGRRCGLRAGACFFDSALSFAIVRGRHLDAAVLGAYQVSERGDLANWRPPWIPDRAGSVGGAMDIAVGAKRVIVAMQHVGPGKELRIVRHCTAEVTAVAAVNLIVTELAVIDVTADGLVLRECAPGVTVEQVIAATEAPLRVQLGVQGAPQRWPRHG